MKWDTYTSKNHVAYTGTAEFGDSVEFLHKTFSEFWKMFAQTVMPWNQEVSWDFIRVEFWADSGRIIVYPMSSNSPYRIEKASCQMILPSFVDFWEELADSDVSDEDFGRIVTKREEYYAQLLEKVAKEEEIGRTLTETTVEFRFFSTESKEPFFNSIIS